MRETDVVKDVCGERNALTKGGSPLPEERQTFAAWLLTVVAEVVLLIKIVLISVEHMWERPAMCESQAMMAGKTVIVTGATSDSKQVKYTEDGYEEIFQVNYLAPFLLTVLLADLLMASSPSRVVNVVSDYHRLGDVDRLEDKARGINPLSNPTAVYGNTKLALSLFTIALAERLKHAGVTANFLHPGAVKTGIADKRPGLRKFFFYLLLGINGKTPWQGAQTTIKLAVDPDLAGTTGEYFRNCALAAPKYRSPYLSEPQLADEVFKSSLKILQCDWAHTPSKR
ncbi:retinol dehydrogenase 14-like isoform X2 [Haemaphysalis longicornis]